MARFNRLWMLLALAMAANGQQAQLDQILQKVNDLQTENQRLNREIETLKQQVQELRLPASSAPVEEKLDVVAQRVEDLADAKIETAERFGLKLSGLVLMNTYLYAGRIGAAELPLVGVPGQVQRNAGATFRNTQINLLYNGPRGIWSSKVTGKLQLDFFGGSNVIQNHLARIRTADLSLHWASRTLSFAVDKPILSPRDPDSLSQLGVPALANSGNLWLWQPQIRYEERIRFTETTGMRARIVVPTGARLSRSRPALQGRFALFHRTAGGREFEFAPGFHYSRSQAAGLGVASYAISADWFVPLAPRVDWTGFAFTGENLTGLGIAGLRQAFTFRNNRPIPVRGRGGWTQVTVHAGSKADVNLIAGMQDDFNRDLAAGGVGKNLSYAANLRFKLAPNVVFGPEVMQIRTRYVPSGTQLINRYDVALGYLF
jgi:hypothetical protein